MIALNEILKNRDYFEKKYRLMGKKVQLDRIFLLEKKFILTDRQANENRAICNKLCAEVAELVNLGKNVNNLISQINKLDKQINLLEKKSKKAMIKINNNLRKLPNPALDENNLNIPLKTTENEEFKMQNFIDEISKFCKIEHIDCDVKSYLYKQKNVVLKKENLPQIVSFSAKKSKKTVLLVLTENNVAEVFDTLSSTLSQNAKYATCRSIRYLKPCSAKEISAMLCDKTIVYLDLLGEYVSRDISLKFYDKAIDMTKFVNMIRIEMTSR